MDVQGFRDCLGALIQLLEKCQERENANVQIAAELLREADLAIVDYSNTQFINAVLAGVNDNIVEEGT